MKKIEVHVNDLMQHDYTYFRTEPEGKNFHYNFHPELSPPEMLRLGIFGGRYMTDCTTEFSANWFDNVRFCHEKHDPELNFFGINASQSLAYWREHGWINPADPRGWFQWYCRYFSGRRGDDDERQIKRFRAMLRHIAQVHYNCNFGDLSCRRRQRQALLQWSYDSRRM